MLNACPSCSTGVIATGSTNSDDQPKKPSLRCQFCGDSLDICRHYGTQSPEPGATVKMSNDLIYVGDNNEVKILECPKPDASPREYQLCRLFEGGGEVIHWFVDKSAYDAKCEEVAEAYEKYRLIKKANNELSRTDHVNFGKLIEERDALKQRVAELEASQEQFEQIDRQLAWLTSQEIPSYEADLAAAKAEIERLQYQGAAYWKAQYETLKSELRFDVETNSATGWMVKYQRQLDIVVQANARIKELESDQAIKFDLIMSHGLRIAELEWQLKAKVSMDAVVIADGYEAREQKLVAEIQRLTECLKLSNAVIKKNKGGG